MNRAEKRRHLKAAKKKARSKRASVQPHDIQQALDLAMQRHAAGGLSEAKALYEQILTIHPDQPDALHYLGVIAYQGGNGDVAVDLINKALSFKPNYDEAHGNLGLVLQGMGRLGDALDSYDRALALNPDFVEAHFNRGNVLQELGRAHDAVVAYRAAVALHSDHAPAHYNLGNALSACGQFEDAIASYDKAITIDPAYAEAHGNLGLAMKELGRVADAAASFQKAVDIEPGLAAIHNNLGNTLHQLGRLDDAVDSFSSAFAINPDLSEAHINLGAVFLDQGDVDAAREQYDLALAVEPENTGLHIMKALMLPAIPASSEDIDACRKTMSAAVRAISDDPPESLNSPEKEGSTNFYLAYHEKNNRQIAKEIADMHLTAFPQLGYEAAHCVVEQQDKRDVLRVGFISAHLYAHTIGKLNLGLMRQLSRDNFEVILLRPKCVPDDMSVLLDAAADKVVVLDKNLELDWKTIENEKLDILFYPDIGMDDYIYYLAYARLAPVQATTWGHPDTTGIPNMDYFISSDTLEAVDGEDHYNEQLIKLDTLGIHYYRPNPPKKKYTRADYGLPDGGRLYVCPQTLFKFHPDFDRVLGNLLGQDDDGKLVLIDDNKGGSWKKLLMERFNRSFPDAAQRVIFVPQMDFDKFLGLVILADAVLDIPSFSGGNSSIELFAMGVPIVTLPGKFLRGRITLACYKQMGLGDLIASDEENYVSLALRLAKDADFRAHMQADILANSDKLFETIAPVRQLETFFKEAHDAWRQGQKKIQSLPKNKPEETPVS